MQTIQILFQDNQVNMKNTWELEEDSLKKVLL